VGHFTISVKITKNVGQRTNVEIKKKDFLNRYICRKLKNKNVVFWKAVCWLCIDLLAVRMWLGLGYKVRFD
jgi:hypothetical protein